MNIHCTGNRTQFALGSGGAIEVHTDSDGDAAPVALIVCGSPRTPCQGISIVTMDVDELGHLGARLLAIAARLGHEHECKCNHNQSLVVKGS